VDFRSPGADVAGVQDDHNRKGVISNRGQRKAAFYTLQRFYSKMVSGAGMGSQTH